MPNENTRSICCASLDDSEISSRISRLQKKLSGGHAALVTSETNIRYLTGFANSEGVMLVSEKESFLIVDFRYGEAASKQVRCCETVVYDSMSATLKDLLSRTHTEEVLIEAESMTVHRASTFRRIFSECGCKMISTNELDILLSNLRMIKSRTELERISIAQKITEEAFTELLDSVRVGAKESDLALELEFLMRKKGASGVSFDLITITGKKTSMPHGVPGGCRIRSGDFVTFDIGAIYDGYHSDMTRTLAVGNVSDEQREIYSIVLKAQTAALSKVRPGVKASDIDKAARDIITEHGLGEYFKHSTGHGVGLMIHEQPFVSAKSATILSSGMVITVEPGIYLPDKFGVRIEDMAVVTKDGYSNFATLPKELITL